MSHSQFRRVKTYTETCMDESLRQAYDYWQDQPGSIRRPVIPQKLGNSNLLFQNRSWKTRSLRNQNKTQASFNLATI